MAGLAILVSLWAMEAQAGDADYCVVNKPRKTLTSCMGEKGAYIKNWLQVRNHPNCPDSMTVEFDNPKTGKAERAFVQQRRADWHGTCSFIPTSFRRVDSDGPARDAADHRRQRASRSAPAIDPAKAERPALVDSRERMCGKLVQRYVALSKASSPNAVQVEQAYSALYGQCPDVVTRLSADARVDLPARSSPRMASGIFQSGLDGATSADPAVLIGQIAAGYKYYGSSSDELRSFIAFGVAIAGVAARAYGIRNAATVRASVPMQTNVSVPAVTTRPPRVDRGRASGISGGKR